MYIFLGILAFIAILLLSPFLLIIKYDEKDIKIYARFLIFKYTIHPRKEKKKKVGGLALEPMPQKKNGFDEFRGKHHQVMDFLKAATPEIKKLLKKGLVSVLKLKVVVATDDAAETAIQYGKMNAYIFGALALLENFVRIKKKKIHIGFDFTKDEYDWQLYIRFMLLPIVGTIVGIRLLINYGKNTVAERQDLYKKNEKKGGVPK